MKASSDHVRQSLARAFALPKSGAFQDLIAAIDRAANDGVSSDSPEGPARSPLLLDPSRN